MRTLTAPNDNAGHAIVVLAQLKQQLADLKRQRQNPANHKSATDDLARRIQQVEWEIATMTGKPAEVL